MSNIIKYDNSTKSEAVQSLQQVEESDSIQLRVNDLSAQISDLESPEREQQADNEELNSEKFPYYHETVSKIDEATTSLQKSIGGPLSGLAIETLNIVEEAIALLEG
ncbi:MAG: hypothetical protein K940chlam6_01415, partial [Chlamydiae bacterium]|nr:hypothetical protein [Chlamydiota bacterium]